MYRHATFVYKAILYSSIVSLCSSSEIIMANPTPPTPSSLLFFLGSFFLFFFLTKAHHPTELTITLLHPLPSTTFSDLTSTDDARLLYLSTLVAAPIHRKRKSAAPIASGRQTLQSPNYVVRLSVGTPRQRLLLAVDTSNDVTWIPSANCLGCGSTSASFVSKKSTTFNPVHCNELECKQVSNPTCNSLRNTCRFNMTYGGSSFEAAMSKETLAIAGDVFPSYTLGFIKKATGNSLPPQGLLGLGRGQLSLLSQTKSTYSSTFSYCLPTFKSSNFSGSLRLGTKGQPVNIKYTQLLTNPHRPSLYYVNMIGIRVGRKIVKIPPSALAFDTVTGGGTIVDSGTMFTRLVEPAYIAVRDEFRRRVRGNVSSLGGFDTCYNGPIVAPTITLMFTGMNVTLPLDNVLIHSTAGSISCLAIAAASTTSSINSVLNVIANFQQQNHRVLFDTPNSRVGFAREHCTTTA